MVQLGYFIRGLMCAAVLGVTLGIPSAVMSQNGSQEVSLEDGRLLADRLIEIGQPRAGREIALGLLQADPNDVRALVALARAEMVLGRLAVAQRTATQALSLAQTDSEHLIVSLVVAEIFAQEDQFTRSQLWLRRAQNYANTDVERGVVANAYQTVRQLNPFSVHLSFGLRPSNNVNAGTSNATVTFAYLPGSFSEIAWVVPANERPLSGVQVSADTSLRYRIAQSHNSQTTLNFGIYAQTYIMSQSARQVAPDVTGSSLAYGDLSIGVGHQWVPVTSNSRQYGASLNYKRTFNEDGAIANQWIGDLSVEQRLDPANRLSFGLNLQHAHFITNDVTALTSRLRAQWTHDLDNGRSISAATTITRAQSNDENRDYSSASVSLTYAFGEILPQIDLSTTIQAQWRTFDSVSLDPSGRDDLTTSLNVSAGIGTLEIYGFQPVVSLRAQRNESSVPSFDNETLTLGVDFRSSF